MSEPYFNIRERRVGGDAPIFIIAENGNNHKGNFDHARDVIKVAHAAGADAVSFQYAPIGTLCAREYLDNERFAFLNECELTVDQLKVLCDDVHALGMAFSIAVEDTKTLDVMIEDVGIDFIKLCSPDLTNLPYIRDAAERGLPIFFSTGAAYLGEIEEGHAAMTRGGFTDYVMYHTNSGYPTPVEQANIVQMDLLEEVFGGVKGYCDHTVDVLPPVVAVSRGAKVIEKHITLDRSFEGDDWMVSLEPDEFADMVRMVRAAETMLGSRRKVPMPVEEETRVLKRKSVVMARSKAAGDVLSLDDFAYKLPGRGISPVDAERLVGRLLKSDVEEDQVLTWDQVQDPQ